MYDKELILEVLEQIRRASRTILDRFKPVKTVSDLTDSPAGMEKLDSICMMLIAIGETLKKLDKIFILAENEESPISIDFLEIEEENFSNPKIVVSEGFYILYNLSDDFSKVLRIIAGIKEQKTDNDFGSLEYIDCRYLPKVYLSN